MGDSAARFKAEVLRRLDTVLDGQEDALHQAATIFANTIERGGIIRAFGSGHSHANALEICGRAGGYIQTKVVREPAWGIYEMIDGVGDQFWLKLDLRPEDCLVVISNSGRNPLPIELAQHAQEAGVPVIAVTALEVSRAGITALKTDEEWVGEGYSFGLNATKQGYEILAGETGRRPFVLTLDGWAGTQRFAAVWSGDQNGDDWEYIRMHIPTYLGQGMSGNPNVASDMDGIFGGSAVVATRDFQWKALTPLMLDMDGWGSLPKLPYANGDPHTGICRMYLKLKSCLMPYAYTCAAAAAGIDTGNGDTWLPPVRPLLLSGAQGAAVVPKEALPYQFTLGDALLVAPVFRNTRADAHGNDVRDGIFLPGSADDLWFDYLTGEAHRGGQTLNGYDAPLWKLPLFVRADAIIPCWEPHNNPFPPGEKNPAGLDRTRRVVEFYPALGRPGRTETRYMLFEDDGRTGVSRAHEEPGYGVVDEVDYGGRVLTDFRCAAEGGRVTLLAEPSRGSYEGYDPLRLTTFSVRVTSRPEGVAARCGGRELLVREVADRAELTVNELLARIREAGFVVEPAESAVESECAGVVGLYTDGRWWRMSFGDELAAEVAGADPVSSLDVSVLQNRVISPILGIGDVRLDPRISFVGGIRGVDELERRAGADGVAFSMFATSIDQLLAVADAGLLMPPKSTWFEPKLRSGLFIHRIAK